ncbi:MAG: sortase [Chloroflexi bacterium]|nr:sortase [Chloroflexota bacterium]
MQAGYDYLLAPGRLKRGLSRYIGLALSLVGVLLLVGGGGYYLYATIARSQLDQMNVSLPSAVSVAPDPVPDKPSKVTDIPAPPEIVPPPGIPESAIAGQTVTHGESPLIDVWSDPLSYEPLDYRREVLLRGFTPIELGQAAPLGSLPAATRLILPEIGVDSSVTELAIRDLGDSRGYETPVNTVGHIPEVANPGEAGSSWFFAHLESPIVGEGSVFYNLTRIPDMLKNGQEVFVIAETGPRQYLYRITSTEVLQQDEMRLYNTGWASIHLVSCVPRLVYDYRLVVTGELVGVK